MATGRVCSARLGVVSRAGCQARQRRLLELMAEYRLDRFVTSNYRTAYYLTGSLAAAENPVAFALEADGRSVLVTSAKGEALADRVIPVETYSIRRVVDHAWHDAAALFFDALPGTDTVGVERSATGVMFGQVDAVDATDLILRLRKKKEADEVAEIRESLRLIVAAYDAARATIRPGLTELDVFNAMQAAVVQAAGTFVHLNGDFAVGERGLAGGGMPTRRVIGEGDLYPLDLFPAPHLYFGDTCRTFVAGTPTALQVRAQETVCAAITLAEGMIRPGVRARDVYGAVKEFLDSHEFTEKSFWHHAGHGIGHHGHEAPRIIPGSDDVFEVGDVITLEPGIYTKSIGGGIRIEDNYLVTESGLENLFEYPKEL